MYQTHRNSRSEFVSIRQLNYHVQVWGQPTPDKLPWIMLHGWMDVAASFQFVVDALAHEHYIIAPDWRGFGQTQCAQADTFWFADYLADLDFLLDHYAPSGQINLLGHSMGGNIAMLYAGVRPERMNRLINLEGFGMPATEPAQAPGRYAEWMDQLKLLYQGERDMKTYDSVGSVARRLIKTNPRLSEDKAQWLAQRWAAPNAQGQWSILGHPAHRISNAQLYRLEEVLEIFKRITCPTLSVQATQSSLDQWWKGRYTLEQFYQRLQSVPHVELADIADAGHMLHHDQPQAVAELIERFFA